MEVTIKYHDNDSLTMEEIVKQAQEHYGALAEVNVLPDSTIAYDLIYFGLQQLITKEQVSIMFEANADYQNNLKSLREKVLFKLTEITDQVIVDNETKVS